MPSYTRIYPVGVVNWHGWSTTKSTCRTDYFVLYIICMHARWKWGTWPAENLILVVLSCWNSWHWKLVIPNQIFIIMKIQLGFIKAQPALMPRLSVYLINWDLENLYLILSTLLFPSSYSLSELPECKVPLAMRTDAVDQILAVAIHPAYDSWKARVSMGLIVNLTESPEAHTYLVRRDLVENMLNVCEQRHRMIIQQSSLSQQRKKEDLMVANVLKYVIVLYKVSSPNTPQHVAQKWCWMLFCCVRRDIMLVYNELGLMVNGICMICCSEASSNITCSYQLPIGIYNYCHYSFCCPHTHTHAHTQQSLYPGAILALY